MIVETGAEPILFKNRQMSVELKEEMRLGLGLPITDPRFKKMFKTLQLHYFSDATELLSQVENFYQENVPDLVLYDRYYFAGRILTKLLDVPAVQMTSHFAFYNDLAMRRNGVCENPDAIVEYSKGLDSFLSTYGIKSRGSYWHVENLNIHFIPKEFQHHSDCFDERFCFAGALLNRRFRPLWTGRFNAGPVILISGMSLWNDSKIDYSGRFGMLVDALSELPYQCILSIGDDEFSQELPPNFELNRRGSHLEILPYAALSICHAGMTSTLEAIYHGVPVLMIPESVGCEEVAYRAEELGLGVSLSKGVLSVERIRETVIEMLHDDSLLERVKKMQGVFRRSGGADLAANRVEDYLIDCQQ
jgi:MGT family glycosyltransferase